ncbi:MAG TPA: hypothetical protein VF600_05620 [Abditibacteriaceae bacterium]
MCAETYQPPTPKTPRVSDYLLASENPTRVLVSNAATYQRPKYFNTVSPSRRCTTTTKFTRR